MKRNLSGIRDFQTHVLFFVSHQWRRKFVNTYLQVYGIIYDVFMTSCVVLSLIPLMFSFDSKVSQDGFLFILEMIAFSVFLADFILKWAVSPLHYNASKRMYFLFPFTLNGMFLILTIIPSLWIVFNILNETGIETVFHALVYFRILRLLDVSFNFSDGSLLANSWRRSYKQLISTLFLIAVLVFGLSLTLYQIEISDVDLSIQTEKISSYWDSLYYIFIVMTTVGLGDYLPSNDFARIITIMAAILGVFTIVVPAGIFSGAFIAELRAKQIAYESRKVILEKEHGWAKFKVFIKKIYGIRKNKN